MILYFLDEFKGEQKMPSRMFDPNIMPDYGKLKQMFEVVNVRKNQELLKEVLKNRHVTAELIYQFNLERGFGQKEFVNFLYYLGNLTLQDPITPTINTFRIPNKVIEELYWQYYATVIQDDANLHTETYQLQKVVLDVAQKGNYEAFFEMVEELLEGLSNRDFIQFNEKYVKMAIMAYMYLANVFYVRSEREIKNMGYLDLELLRHTQTPKPHKEFVLEIKYLKEVDKNELDKVQEQARTQLLNYYRNDPELQSKSDLIVLTVVIVKIKVHLQKIEL